MQKVGLTRALCIAPAICVLAACTLVTDTSGLAGTASSRDGGADATSDGGGVDGDWLDPAWTARRAIIIPAARLNTEVRDYPLYVDLASLDGAVKARADGLDIRFTASDGKTPLPHELVAARGAWVRIPKLGGSSDTRLFVYYGNATFAERGSGAAVWDGQYEGVWHLDESADPRLDATSRHQDGNANAVTAAAGNILGAQQFSGSSVVSFPMSAAIAIADTYSFSTWVWIDALNNAVIADGSIGLQFTAFLASSKVFGAIAYEGCNSAAWPAYRVDGSKELDIGRWHHVAVVVKGTATATYVDGIRDGQRTVDATMVASDYGSLRLGIATCNNPGFKGRMDEVRLTKRALDDAWLRADFESQSAPATFAALQGEERR